MLDLTFFRVAFWLFPSCALATCICSTHVAWRGTQQPPGKPQANNVRRGWAAPRAPYFAGHRIPLSTLAAQGKQGR